jgi:ribonuclease R
MTPRRSAQSTKPLKKLVSGVIQITRKGVGYLPWADVKAKAPRSGARPTPHSEAFRDIEIQPEHLRGALNGDVVSVELIGLFPRPKGKVASVDERARTEFVCTLKLLKDQWVALADDVRLYRPITLSPKTISHFPKLATGTKALIKMHHWDGAGDPQGDIVEIIGTAGEHRTEMNAIVLEHGFRTEFSPEVAREAKEIEARHAETIQQELKNRSDFRNVTTFTIDPLTAKDFDDALSVRELGNNEFEIGVHIADVTFFVRPGSKLEEEAQNRGTSVYLVDATIPMLPHELSGNVCSLKEGEDRLAFAAIFKMNSRGDVLERRFERTVINSNKRFTYEEAQAILDESEGPSSSAPSSGSSARVARPEGSTYTRELIILRDLARILRKQREKEGAIDFGDNEVKFELDDEGRPLRVVRKERIETNLLIEEFMLLANREVARYVSELAQKVPEKNLVFLYRIHDEPKADRIEELSTFVRAVGYDFSKSKKNKYAARDISNLLKQIEGTPEEHLIRTATLRSMAKAIYSTKNIGHFGLAFEYYTHFTSPIRRYPDMLVHRILTSHLNGKPLGKREFDNLERLCIDASLQEAKAVDAERDSIRYKQVEFMAGKVGQTFEGVISGVTDWGLYVEEKESAAEGLVRVRTIGDDYYNYNAKAYALVGERTKKKYVLGDAVRIKLVGADLAARTLDYELV